MPASDSATTRNSRALAGAIAGTLNRDAVFNSPQTGLEMVEAAVRMIFGGAKLIATNMDPNCPTQNGIRPGCGAMVAMLETATGV